MQKLLRSLNKVLSKENRQIIFQNRYLEIPAYKLALKTLNRYNDFIRYKLVK